MMHACNDFITNQLTVIFATRGERRINSFRCQKECMKRKLVIYFRKMLNLIKLHHVVKNYEQLH